MVCDTGVACNVDAERGVCDVEIEGKSPAKGALIGDAESGVMTVPKEGSVVAVVWASPVTAVVVMVADVEEVRLMGGHLGGLVKVEELKKWMKNVESDLQTLSTVLKTSVIAGNGAPAGMVFNPQTSSVADSIENEKVRQ